MEKIKDEEWSALLEEEMQKPYFKELAQKVDKEYKEYECFPKQGEIFRALNLCPYSKVKVVILGQDPYYQPNQANGLCFSVNKGNKLPPSLKNIFKAIENDLKITAAHNGELIGWAKQGVLLLNTTLSVRQGKPLSHGKLGWEKFTDKIISLLNERQEGLVFMLWGNNARSKTKIITNSKHLILESVHPSPLSFYHGFLDCKHFSKANEYLIKEGQTPIDWSKEEDI